MEDLLQELMLRLSRMEDDIRMIKMSVVSEVDGEGIPEGWDAQEVGGYVISMTKKPGSNGKKNPVMYLYLKADGAPKKTLTVYPSESHLLPLFVRQAVDWEDGEYERVVELEKPDVIESGKYVEIPPFTVIRKAGKETEIGIQRVLAGVLSLSPAAQELEDKAKIASMGDKVKGASEQSVAVKTENTAKVANSAPKDNDDIPGDVKWAVDYGVFSSIDEALDLYRRMEVYVATKGGDLHRLWRERCMIKYAADCGVDHIDGASVASIVKDVLSGEKADIVWMAKVAIQYSVNEGIIPDAKLATDFYRWAYKKGVKENIDWLIVLGHIRDYMNLPGAKIANVVEEYKDFYLAMAPANPAEHTPQWESYLREKKEKAKA